MIGLRFQLPYPSASITTWYSISKASLRCSQDCHSRESGNPGGKDWIPDQVRNDNITKVIPGTVPYSFGNNR